MIPNEAFIIAAAVIGAAIGTLGMVIYYRPRLARKEKETWNSARLFYTRRKQDA